MTSVHQYFSGEKLQCVIGIIIGLISIGLTLYFFLQLKTPFYKGLAYPFLIISLLLLIICAGVIWRTPRDIERVTSYVNHEPGKIPAEEFLRMEKVLRNFQTIKIIEICLFVGGLVLVGFGLSRGNGFLNGIGVGLAIQAALMFGFDFFAHSRAEIYWKFLQSL